MLRLLEQYSGVNMSLLESAPQRCFLYKNLMLDRYFLQLQVICYFAIFPFNPFSAVVFFLLAVHHRLKTITI